jgi:hypothetical protein
MSPSLASQHPSEGKKLAVFGQRRYQDKSHLILILPKGGRALIPKEWTDIEALSQDPPTQDRLHTHLGSIRDLLHARAVVDALLSRRSSQTGSDDKSVDKENAHLATHAEFSQPPPCQKLKCGKRWRGNNEPSPSKSWHD